jgi:hypothetical protein
MEAGTVEIIFKEQTSGTFIYNAKTLLLAEEK